MNEQWPEILTATLADQAHAAIRARILSGHFKPGEYIREGELSQMLRVSRTPIREALARLGSEGFLERIPHHGFRVPDDSIEDLLHLYPIIASLEVLAGTTSFPRLEEADLKRLHGINEEFGRAMEREEFHNAIELNSRFHHVLSEKCGNPRLTELLDSLRSQVHRLEIWSIHQWDHRTESFAQHQQILARIAAGEYEAALEVLRVNRLQTWTYFYEELGAALRRKETSKGAPKLASSLPDSKER